MPSYSTPHWHGCRENAPSFHQPLPLRCWAWSHSHDAGTAGLFNKTGSQNRVLATPLWPDVVQQTGTNPTLRNYNLSALFTRSFHHKIVSHNSNSHNLLANYHTSCVQHTGCLSKKPLYSSSSKGTGNRGTQGWVIQGIMREAEPFPWARRGP